MKAKNQGVDSVQVSCAKAEFPWSVELEKEGNHITKVLVGRLKAPRHSARVRAEARVFIYRTTRHPLCQHVLVPVPDKKVVPVSLEFGALHLFRSLYSSRFYYIFRLEAW